MGGPPIPPARVGTKLFKHPSPALEIEIFVDFCCPYSRKLFDTVYGGVVGAAPAGQVELILQNVVQCWHPQSAYMHEASLAVRALDEAKFFPFAAKLFSRQVEFFDAHIWDMSRAQIYDALVEIASEFVDAEALRAKLARTIVEGSLNTGNAVTLDLKWATKYHRVRGVHVTPTVFLNGVEAPDVSSGWDADQWAAKVADCLPK